MAFWRRASSGPISLDEFLSDGDARSASPFDVSAAAKDWQKHLKTSGRQAEAEAKRALVLTAFNLIRGGDLFERKSTPARTERALLDQYRSERLRLVHNKVAKPEREAAMDGIMRVLAGNPALCRRMLLVKPIDIVLIPKGDDFRRFGFPRHTNPSAAGIFWSTEREARALIGLREEHILEKPWLMIHEMTHAVHLLGMSTREREDIDNKLMPVYRSRTWVEEAFAIYAERAFGARYGEDDLRAPGLYGKTRRDWNARHVFSLFIAELFRP